MSPACHICRHSGVRTCDPQEAELRCTICGRCEREAVAEQFGNAPLASSGIRAITIEPGDRVTFMSERLQRVVTRTVISVGLDYVKVVDNGVRHLPEREIKSVVRR